MGCGCTQQEKEEISIKGMFSFFINREGRGKVIFLFLLAFSSQIAIAQAKKFERSKDMSVSFGTAYYLGEINPYKHFGGTLKPAFGLAYRNSYDRRWAMRLGLNYGTLSAQDSVSKDPWIRNRNLSFINEMVEGYGLAEFNFFSYQPGNSEFPISPFLFMGISFLRMKPMVEYKGGVFELQPLGTEGQGIGGFEKKYKTNVLGIPFGVGLKFNLYGSLAFSIEWGCRKTWTDYIDDISGKYADTRILVDSNGPLASALSDQSLDRVPGQAGDANAGFQRGDPGRKDFYFFSMASLIFRIDKRATTCWK